MKTRRVTLENTSRALDKELIAVEKNINRLRQRLSSTIALKESKQNELQVMRDDIMSASEAVVLVADALREEGAHVMRSLLGNIAFGLPSQALCELVQSVSSRNSVEGRMSGKCLKAHTLNKSIKDVLERGRQEREQLSDLYNQLNSEISPDNLRVVSEISYNELTFEAQNVDRLRNSLEAREADFVQTCNCATSLMERSEAADVEIAEKETKLEDDVNEHHIRWEQRLMELADAFTQNIKVLKDERNRLTRISNENKHVLLRMGIKPSQINTLTNEGDGRTELGLSSDGSLISVPKSTAVAAALTAEVGHSIEEKIANHRACISSPPHTSKGIKVEVKAQAEVFAQNSLKSIFKSVETLHLQIIEQLDEHRTQIQEADNLYCALTQQRDEREATRSKLRSELSAHQAIHEKLKSENHEWKAIRRELNDFVRLRL